MPPHELYRILFILFTVACMMICIPKEQWESNRIAVGADKCSDNTTSKSGNCNTCSNTLRFNS